MVKANVSPTRNSIYHLATEIGIKYRLANFVDTYIVTRIFNLVNWKYTQYEKYE